MTFISYSQNLEDVMLWRALNQIKKGFYVDVGANDPVLLSVTNAFYQRGWHGINIDPSTYDFLCKERSRDINLELFASSVNGDVVFYDVSNSALSTSDPKLAEQYRQEGQSVVEKKIPSRTLNQILDTYADGPIHFMNIDVEGAELEVLKGLDLTVWRPWIILLEATIPTTTEPAFEKWEGLIISCDYEFVYSDGLNRFYIAKEHQELKVAFQLPPNIFDQYVLSQQVIAQQELEAKEEFIQTQNRELAETRKTIELFQTSYLFWMANGPFRWFPPLRLAVRFIKRFRDIVQPKIRSVIGPKIGVLSQYPPRPIYIPKSYFTASTKKIVQVLPSISIVTPSYNQGEFIGRTIKSVLDQKYLDIEYIVQDGNSTDDTSDVLKYYEKEITYFEMRDDDGQAHAVNLGFSHTKGEIMAYLNSDDILLPGSLLYVANYFVRHPEVDVVYSHRVVINEKDQEIGRWVLPPHDNDIIRWSDYVPQETLFWRRSLWEKIGGCMDESYQFALDWDLILRFKDVGANFRRLPRFLGAFRFHSDQKTSMQMNSVGMNEMNRLRKQVHGREVTWQEVNKKIYPYLMRSTIYHSLYNSGILRY